MIGDGHSDVQLPILLNLPPSPPRGVLGTDGRAAPDLGLIQGAGAVAQARQVPGHVGGALAHLTPHLCQHVRRQTFNGEFCLEFVLGFFCKLHFCNTNEESRMLISVDIDGLRPL